MQWMALFHKEMLGNWRNRKWIWVPLVFMLLTSMDPLSYYFLPDIIEFAGGLPENAMIEIPTIKNTEAIMMSLDELGTFGIIVIALFSMGTLAGERKNGQAEMMLVRPIRYTNYVTAKWTSLLLLTWASFTLGMFLSWYYINLLFGGMSLLLLFKVIGFYGVWLAFVLTLSFLYSAICRTPGVVAACTILTIAMMSGINMAFGHRLTWFPNQLSAHIQTLVMNENVSRALVATTSIIVMLIIILLVASIAIFRSKEVVH
jgi:ABC-2 type transport system permease protein